MTDIVMIERLDLKSDPGKARIITSEAMPHKLNYYA